MIAIPGRKEVPLPPDPGRAARWGDAIHAALAALFRDRPDVTVARRTPICPTRRRPNRGTVPDVFVAFGPPRRDRRRYNVWEEGGVYPQVVVVVRADEGLEVVARKLLFNEKYGAEEFLAFDPETGQFEPCLQSPADRLYDAVEDSDAWISPRLGVRFGVADELGVTDPAGRPVRALADRAADADRLRALCLAAGIDPDRA